MGSIREMFPGVARDPKELESEWRKFVGKKRGGWFVGKGVVFRTPPVLKIEGGDPKSGYDISLEEQPEQLSEQQRQAERQRKLLLKANALAKSKYRNQVIFVYRDPDSGSLSFKGIAYMPPLHARLLEGVSPGSCISKEEFDVLTASIRARSEMKGAQTDGPRRWRELRNEYGFNVWRDKERGYCRGPEEVPVREPWVRPDTTKLTEDMLPVLAAQQKELVCAKCGAPLSFEKFGVVAKGAEAPGVVDHRRPVFYGGTDVVDNLQLLCVRCNNLKRTYCERCPLGFQCERCSWAYPEHVVDYLVIRLRPLEAAKFEELLKKYQGKPPEVARKLLLEAIEKDLER